MLKRKCPPAPNTLRLFVKAIEKTRCFSACAVDPCLLQEALGLSEQTLQSDIKQRPFPFLKIPFLFCFQ